MWRVFPSPLRGGVRGGGATGIEFVSIAEARSSFLHERRFIGAVLEDPHPRPRERASLASDPASAFARRRASSDKRGREKIALPIFGNSLDACRKSLEYRAILSRKRGRRPSSRTLGQVAVDAAASSRAFARGRAALKRTAKACGPDARIAGVKFPGS